jgi:hypothetical protein
MMTALWSAPAAMATPAPGPVSDVASAAGIGPDTMLINDGGTAFHTVPIPETGKGWGGWVEPVDYDGNGTTDFVVANGANDVAGPIQLISFARPANRALPDQTAIGRRDARSHPA